MGYMMNTARTYPLSTRARGEAYAGLFLLLVGLTVLTFRPCPAPVPVNHRIIGEKVRTDGGALPGSVAFGSASEDGQRHKGWWVGHFASGAAQRTSDVETKWISHRAGTKHDGWSTNKVATSMAVLISGKHRLEFRGSHVLLENQGDYVIWGPGVEHSWTALEKSTIMCVRWPSVPGDQKLQLGGNETIASVRMASQSGQPGPVTESAKPFEHEFVAGTIND